MDWTVDDRAIASHHAHEIRNIFVSFIYVWTTLNVWASFMSFIYVWTTNNKHQLNHLCITTSIARYVMREWKSPNEVHMRHRWLCCLPDVLYSVQVSPLSHSLLGLYEVIHNQHVSKRLPDNWLWVSFPWDSMFFRFLPSALGLVGPPE